MINEVMSFVCSDSCENGIKKEEVLAKGSGKSPFSEYLWFQSNSLEFSKCLILGRTCAIWWKKKRGQEAEFHLVKEGFEKIEHACSVEGILWVSDSTALTYFKVACPTRKILSTSKLRKFLK